jgi:xanthine dehydrogenase YagS FAD-binding subunit
MLQKFNYAKPASVREAVRLLAGPGSRVHAGGTDLLGCLRDQVFAAEKIVSLSQVNELKGIAAATGGGLRIGAMTPLAEVASNRQIAEQYPALAQAAAAVASPQLRNQGTIAGNLCQRPRCWYFRGEFHCARKGGDTCFALEGENHYHCILGGSACRIVHPSDTAPALLALDAKLRITGAAGPKTVPLSSFFVLPAQNIRKENILEPGDIVTDILLPALKTGMRSSYRKVRGRGAWDFALAGVALAMVMSGKRVEQARVVFSGVAPIPWRSEAAERAIAGKELDASTVAQAAQEAVKDAEPLTHNEYKVALTRGVLTDALLAI